MTRFKYSIFILLPTILSFGLVGVVAKIAWRVSGKVSSYCSRKLRSVIDNAPPKPGGNNG